jgi:hypothetical protein
MSTSWSSLLLVVVLAGCASKAPPTSSAAPPARTVAEIAPTAPPPPVVLAPPVATATPKAPQKHATKLSVKRIAIASGVAHREPVDPSATFDAGTKKVYAFVEIENPERLPGEITVEFQPPSKKYEGQITLGVGDKSRWRTWAFTRQAHESGEWTAIVRDERGRELARQTFAVTA